MLTYLNVLIIFLHDIILLNLLIVGHDMLPKYLSLNV